MEMIKPTSNILT